jgi:hypothetical protein
VRLNSTEWDDNSIRNLSKTPAFSLSPTEFVIELGLAEIGVQVKPTLASSHFFRASR